MTSSTGSQDKCNHDEGFSLELEVEDLPAAFVCNKKCGYFLNFDPHKYPYGLAYMPSSAVLNHKVIKLSKGGKY